MGRIALGRAREGALRRGRVAELEARHSQPVPREPPRRRKLDHARIGFARRPLPAAILLGAAREQPQARVAGMDLDRAARARAGFPRLAEGELDRRVPGDTATTEVGRLARALNVMLGRIQDAFAARDATEAELRVSDERLRRFVADASHELRTPLAAVAAYAELFFSPLMWPEFGPEALLDAVRDFTTRERRFGGLPDAAAG